MDVEEDIFRVYIAATNDVQFEYQKDENICNVDKSKRTEVWEVYLRSVSYLRAITYMLIDLFVRVQTFNEPIFFCFLI